MTELTPPSEGFRSDVRIVLWSFVGGVLENLLFDGTSFFKDTLLVKRLPTVLNMLLADFKLAVRDGARMLECVGILSDVFLLCTAAVHRPSYELLTLRRRLIRYGYDTP